VKEFSTPFIPPDRILTPKINKDTLELSNNKDEMDVTDIYRVFHLTAADYTSFSAANGTFSIVGHCRS
jgi:hypothetical protein